ncbi:glioma pathogenesis-related protein 1-like isoform X3 [Scyliorhinus canicula]|uniref:glioma pathogenesis-related protein 1-like isoform X3 n=1 Tax=Scyliorhinus canicula TaxID=7830 RepID=UPI0018F563DA|nr:glioma pathogenesis-related protein 1-like isoform X3 [Scyliorhinus canicula]
MWRPWFCEVSLYLIFNFAVLGAVFSNDINEDFIRESIRAHNFYRSKVDPPASNMLYMSWDRILANVALGWSKNCRFEHNKDLKVRGKLHPVFPVVGENIYVTEGSSLNVSRAIQNWHGEVKDYDYVSRRCTNLVWASSYKVGCAFHICPSGIADFSGRTSVNFVCDYGPAGNFPTHPYLTGKACSKCFKDRCENNLCRNRTLEMSTDDSDSLCDNYCIAVLVIRPLSLIVIVIGVYFAQSKYPNMFAYL